MVLNTVLRESVAAVSFIAPPNLTEPFSTGPQHLMFTMRKNLLTQAIVLAGVGLSASLLIGFANSVHPAFDTFTQFRLHVSVGVLVIAMLLLAMRFLIPVLIFVPLACVGIYGSLTGTPFTASSQAALSGKPVYTLLHANLYWQNENKESALRTIADIDADIMTLAEQSADWRRLFAGLDERWPHRFGCQNHPRGNATAVYSKWPMVSGSQYCGIYSSLAQISVEAPTGIPLDLGAVHMRWPWPASGPRQLLALKPRLAQLGTDGLIAGDFNSVTWSHTTQEFARAGNMSLIPGIGPTWIVDLPIVRHLFWAGLPIDNVMAKGGVRVLSATRLEGLGSDHLPVLVRFQLQ